MFAHNAISTLNVTSTGLVASPEDILNQKPEPGSLVTTAPQWSSLRGRSAYRVSPCGTLAKPVGGASAWDSSPDAFPCMITLDPVAGTGKFAYKVNGAMLEK